MKYPEVCLIPVLMLADYYLTILGAVLMAKQFSNYVVFEQYELNPRFQKAINNKKLINGKLFLCILMVTACAVYIAEISPFPAELVILMLGYVLTIYSVIVGRHIANIFIYLYFLKRPDNIKGKIEYTHEASLFMSIYYNFIPLIALLVVYIYEKSLFVLGGILGIASMTISHFQFLKKRKEKKAEEVNNLENNLQK